MKTLFWVLNISVAVLIVATGVLFLEYIEFRTAIAHEIEPDTTYERDSWRERGRAFGEGLILSLIEPGEDVKAEGLTDSELRAALQRLRRAWE